MDRASSNETAPDDERVRDASQGFADALPWCVDVDLALAQLTRLIAGFPSVASVKIFFRHTGESIFELAKTSAAMAADELAADDALVRHFETEPGETVLTAFSCPPDAGSRCLQGRDASAAFAIRELDRLAGLVLVSLDSEEGESARAATEIEIAVRALNGVLPEMIRAEGAEIIGGISRGVTHDVRSCLASVSTLLQLTDENPADPTVINALLPSAREGLTAALDIIDRARSMRRSAVFEPAPVALRDAIERAVELSRPDARHKNVMLSVEMEDEFLVAAEATLLTRLFRNLLANAIRASPSGGETRLCARLSPGRTGTPGAAVAVEDDGPGMGDETRKRALKMRPGELPARSGLGLAICRGLVRYHSGEFTLDSRKGGGTAVRVWLPLWNNDLPSPGG